MFTLVTVRSGARSLRSLRYGETFHPVIGPVEEANRLHIAQQRLQERAAGKTGPLMVWDVGLGAAANALAVVASMEGGAPIALHSFEIDLGALKYALAHSAELSYIGPYERELRALIGENHVRLGAIDWTLHRGCFRETLGTEKLPPPQAILYDPYSPASNPALWTLEAFREIHAALSCDAPCLLTSYSRSTAVRAALLLAGFFVGKGAGIGEKEETTIATNALSLLEEPLGEAWLERARRSSQGSPPRDGGFRSGPISGADWESLRAHPQFGAAAVKADH